MNITFLRHATAQDRELPIEDYERVLVDKGYSQINSVANFCKKNSLYPGVILSSPYPRALQTAQKLFDLLPDFPRPDIADWLKLESDPKEAVNKIIEYVGKTEDLWLVGHEPDFSLIIATLIGAHEESIKIKKASLTRITLSHDNSATIMWSIPCKMMNKI